MGKLTSQSFAQLYFQVGRVKAVIARSFLIPCKAQFEFCAEWPKSDLAYFDPDPALMRQTLYMGGATLSHQPIHAVFSCVNKLARNFSCLGPFKDMKYVIHQFSGLSYVKHLIFSPDNQPVETEESYLDEITEGKAAKLARMENLLMLFQLCLQCKAYAGRARSWAALAVCRPP